MKRKLAVPLAVSRVKDRAVRMRTLKESEDAEDVRILAALAENRLRLERIEKDLEREREFYAPEDMFGELDQVKASIQLGLLEIADELQQVPDSEEILESATA